MKVEKLDAAPLRLVRLKVTDNRLFSPCRKPSGAGARELPLPDSAVWPEGGAEIMLPDVNTEKVSSAQAVAGTSQPTNHAIFGIKRTGLGNRRRSSPADGRRGCQECSCASSEFISFINQFFRRLARAFGRAGGQLEFHFLQAISVAAGSCVWRNVQ